MLNRNASNAGTQPPCGPVYCYPAPLGGDEALLAVAAVILPSWCCAATVAATAAAALL